MRTQKTVTAAVLAAVVGIAMSVAAVQQAAATPAIAKKTGQACNKCHTAPPALNDYGKKYKAGNK